MSIADAMPARAALALVAALACHANAQWAPLADLPGADEVRRLGDPGGRAGRISEVRWDASARRAWFQHAGRWKWIAFDGGAVQEGGEPPELPPAKPEYRPPRGGRAKQATEVPSPDGAWVAAHRDLNVVLEPRGPQGGSPVQVTAEGAGQRWFGRADWVYGEELDQSSAMWWSPDSRRIAYYDFDESPVPQYALLAGLAGLRTRIESCGYPKPGDPNPVARLEVFDLATRARTKIDVGASADQYVYGARWSPNGDALLWQDSWGTVAAHFGMRTGADVPMNLTREMPAQADGWRRVVERHGLREVSLEGPTARRPDGPTARRPDRRPACLRDRRHGRARRRRQLHCALARTAAAAAPRSRCSPEGRGSPSPCRCG